MSITISAQENLPQNRDNFLCVCRFGVIFTYVIEGIDAKLISVCLINDIADLHILINIVGTTKKGNNIGAIQLLFFSIAPCKIIILHIICILFASFWWLSLSSYCSSNYCCSKSCRSLSLLGAIANPVLEKLPKNRDDFLR